MDEPTSAYADDALVYVDPDTRKVIGPVEWGADGNPKKLEMIRPGTVAAADEEEEEPAAAPAPAKKGSRGGRRPFKPRKRYYPWGTYKSMKKLYRIEGKVKEEEGKYTLDQAIEKSAKDPYWD